MIRSCMTDSKLEQKLRVLLESYYGTAHRTRQSWRTTETKFQLKVQAVQLVAQGAVREKLEEKFGEGYKVRMSANLQGVQFADVYKSPLNRCFKRRFWCKFLRNLMRAFIVSTLASSNMQKHCIDCLPLECRYVYVRKY